MIKNFLLLWRTAEKLNDLLTGYTMYSAFSQEKERIILECRSQDHELFIEISVNPQLPYITVREKYSRAKKNLIRLFENLSPSPITGISCASRDRVIKISLQSSAIYFMIRGSRTNVLAVKDDTIMSFKKSDSAVNKLLHEEFMKLSFGTLDISFSKDDNTLTDRELLKKYPFLGKEILAEARLRDSNDIAHSLASVVTDLLNNKPALYFSGVDVKIAVEEFNFYKKIRSEVFEDITSAVNKYITVRRSTNNLEIRKKQLIVSVERDLERTASKLNNLMTRIDQGSKEQEYNKLGSLLLINLNMITKGTSEITVSDLYADKQEIKIKINPSLSPQKNADNYFEKARNEKINYSKSVELYKTAVSRYNELKKKAQMLKSADKIEDFRKMDTNLGVVKKQKGDIKDKFRQYIIDGEYTLYVGKDGRNNDLLTTKFAKQNDYWFHARSVSGSHVVLRADNPKTAVPKSVLKKAAAIAAFHSKAKTAGVVPVSYTLKKYVTKRKDMEPGKVKLLREEVLLVKPEIPAGCEYVSAD